MQGLRDLKLRYLAKVRGLTKIQEVTDSISDEWRIVNTTSETLFLFASVSDL